MYTLYFENSKAAETKEAIKLLEKLGAFIQKEAIPEVKQSLKIKFGIQLPAKYPIITKGDFLVGGLKELQNWK